jgi:hypothetical protein
MDLNQRTAPQIRVPEISPQLRKKYDQLLAGIKPFGKATSGGIEVAGTVHTSLTGRITTWDTYYYRWVDGHGQVKYPIDGTAASEIISLGLRRGVTFTFEVTGLCDAVLFSCSYSSYIAFSGYVAGLVTRGLTLETVITKLSSRVRNFKKGSAPVLVFELVKACDEATPPTEVAGVKLFPDAEPELIDQIPLARQ